MTMQRHIQRSIFRNLIRDTRRNLRKQGFKDQVSLSSCRFLWSVAASSAKVEMLVSQLPERFR